MSTLVIFGTGAHARKAFHCWTLAGGSVLAFSDDNQVALSPVPGYPVIAASDLDRQLPVGQMFIAIGQAEVRERLMARYEAVGWRFPALVHPKASVAPDALLEAGVIVAAGGVVESGARVGRGAIVDIGALIDHDCLIGDFSHLRPGQVCLPGTTWPV